MAFRWEDARERARNHAVLVIDTLRATTTIVGLLQKGASRVLACPTVEDAFRHRVVWPDAVLGGERNNRAPKGFDAGNSIFEYSEAMLAGRSVIFTTTNGTQAIEAVAKTASWVGLACLRNREMAGIFQQRQSDEGLLVCAGTAGAVSWEDTITAGAVVDTWPPHTWTDGARLAWTAFNQHRDDLLVGILASSHARVLEESGMGRDIEYAAELDASQVNFKEST